MPTVVLVDVRDGGHETSPDDDADSFPFLRTLSANIHGARYLKQVMPFALSDTTLDASTTTSCFKAGAIDIFHGPFSYEDLNRLVGHVKETIRPSARLLGANMVQNLVDSIRSIKPTKIATHRPDQIVPAKRRKAVEDAVGQWHFPAQDFGMDELTYAAMFMLEHMLQVPDLETFRIPREELITFLLAARRQYKHHREVYYHNWRHAVDVTQSLYCFLLDVHLCPPLPSDQRQSKRLNAVERLLTPFDGLILLVSAIGHDVGHPGVNNAFLVACNHPLAQTYNDKSVLENYHCAAYSQLLRRHWPALSRAGGFRSTMISTILATDMQRHFEYMSSLTELKQKVERSHNDLGDWKDKDREQTRELMMALLMKAADISNVARPFDISATWAKTLMNEFSRQGELESELGIPTCLFGGPPVKEDILAAAQSQKGFMGLFGYPLFSNMIDVMPSVSCAIAELENNQEIWSQKIEHEMRKRGSGGEGTTPLTFSSVSKDEVEEAEVRHHKSLPDALLDAAPQSPSTSRKRHPTVDSELAPHSHAASQQRHYTAIGGGHQDEMRSSTPFLPPSTLSLSPGGGASRRSSKDVALDQYQQLSAFAHGNLSPNSRRGSADGSWQVHQSYPGSRRGSKDESLTTILVSSQGSPGKRSSPPSPGKTPQPDGSPDKRGTKRQSVSQSQKTAARTSVPSSRSHATSSATAATSQCSPSTQPSSLAPTDDETTPPARHHQSIAATEDPFAVPGNWPTGLDGIRHASGPDAIPNTPPLPSGRVDKSDSPRIIARMASGESDDAGARGTPRKSERVIRESRSRSRLRQLKFWKKKRDVSGAESGDSISPGES